MTLKEMKRIKEERGYSLAMLSQYSGVPLGTVQKIFAGKTERPRLATLLALEKVLMAEEELYQGKAYSYEAESRQSEHFVHEPSASYGAESPAKKPGEYTLEDYYALPDDQRVELIDGVFYSMSSPNFIHQVLAGEIYAGLLSQIRQRKGKCIPAVSPVDVQLDCDEKTVVQPDVLIVCDRSKIKEFGIYGAPDFVLEILSKSTRKKDCTIKLAKYIEAGVREYWIVDPVKKNVITYDFREEGIPVIHSLEGELGLAIYDYEVKIDLNLIAEQIEEYGKEDIL